MENKTRLAVGASAFALSVVGIAYTGYSVLDAIMSLSPIVRFLVGAGVGGAGIFVAAESIKR